MRRTIVPLNVALVKDPILSPCYSVVKRVVDRPKSGPFERLYLHGITQSASSKRGAMARTRAINVLFFCLHSGRSATFNQAEDDTIGFTEEVTHLRRALRTAMDSMVLRSEAYSSEHPLLKASLIACKAEEPDVPPVAPPAPATDEHSVWREMAHYTSVPRPRRRTSSTRVSFNAFMQDEAAVLSEEVRSEIALRFQ